MFGALEITHGQDAPAHPPTQRVLALLGYLIARHDVPQSRDKLVDLLWPDLMPRQGRRMLSDTLWRARRLLMPPGLDETPTLAIAHDTVTFRSDPSTRVDLLVFEQQIRLAERPDAAEVALLREAIALYRGDFLETCYDDWALYERERLRESYLSALQRLLAYDQERRAYDLALESALRLVRADPLREEAHRALMRLYYLLGREADALRAYEQCSAALREELGVEPEPETLSLYEEIAAMWRRRTGAPQQLGGQPPEAMKFAIAADLPFVGRQAARSEVMDAIEGALAGAGGMVLVAGAAGQGKSRLLREVATGAEWRGAQVSWGGAREDAQALPFGPLREALEQALTPLRARQVADLLPAHTMISLLPLLPRLAERLPELSLLAPQPGHTQIASLHAALTDVLLALGQVAPQILILEDLHWFDEAALAALAALLPQLRAAPVLLVVSGRADEIQRRAGVWDALLRFDRAGLLRRVELHGMSAEECTNLVRRALRMPNPAPRFSARLAAATGGNPFFILETLRALNEQGRLTRDERGVWRTPWDTPDTDYHELDLPVELRQAIDERLRELPPSARETLDAAAVLGTTFSPSTLARMTGETEQTAAADAQRSDAQTLERSNVQALVTDQLLRRQFLVEDDAGYRFGHETLREVIYGELSEPDRRELHLRAAAVLEQEHYARVEALAQHLYLAGAWQKAIPHLVQAGDRARVICAYRDALRCYDQALAAAGQLAASGGAGEADTRRAIHLKRGEVFALLSHYAKAIGAYEQALRLAESNGAGSSNAGRSAQIQALNGLCFVYGLTNEYDSARTASRRAMALADASPRLQDRADTCYHAGQTSYHMNAYAEALTYLQQALELYEAVDSQGGQARCLELLAWTWRRQEGVTDRVVENLERALSIYRTLGDDYHERLCRVSLANVHLLRGAFDEVLRACDAVLPFFRSTHARYTIAECQYLRGVALYAVGRLTDSLAAWDETIAICAELGISAAVEVNRMYRGQVLRALERYDEGLRDLQAACATDDRLVKPRALIALAELWLDRGDLDRAYRAAAEAVGLAQEVGSQPYLGVALRLLGQVRAAGAGGRLPAPTEALPDEDTCFKTSAELLAAARYESELALTCARYGAYLLDRRRAAEGAQLLLQAQALARRCGMATLLQTVLADLQRAAGQGARPQQGQVRVRLPRQGVPRGRPLRTDEFAEVIWTIESAEDEEARLRGGKVAERQIRLRRLCTEALEQGTEPTVGDLAVALGVTERTVDRDIAALRAAGETVLTRGAAQPASAMRRSIGAV